jgi:hypothetical protein
MGTDARSTVSKKTKITNFTFENVEEEVKLILEEYGNKRTPSKLTIRINPNI